MGKIIYNDKKLIVRKNVEDSQLIYRIQVYGEPYGKSNQAKYTHEEMKLFLDKLSEKL